MQKSGRWLKYQRQIILSIAILFLGATGYLWHLYNGIDLELQKTRLELQDTKARFDALTEERNYIYDNLLSEQAKNTLFENQIKEIAGTVGLLDKLSKTDEELLQKYSRVYFLNEHYLPEGLATITPEYIFEPERNHRVHLNVLPYLLEMAKAAEENETPIRVVSAYRSFAEQTVLKGRYLVTYGSGSNRFSADQGYSEHQLGTAVDFTTSALGSDFTDFGETKAFAWLKENAYKYGFVLSYPDGNAYYQYEPWHWRFVGKKLALRLHNENENFYDLDQRIIQNYLLTIFD